MRYPIYRIAPIVLAALAACSSEVATKPADTRMVGCICEARVSPASAVLNAGDRIQFIVVDGARYGSFRWRSSNSAIATVDSLTGVTTAIGSGSATIIAAAVKDPSVQAAAALTVAGSPGSLEAPVIESVNEVTTGLPANLAGLKGDIDVVASMRASVSAINTASLVITNGLRDTTVATQTLAAGATARWTLRWATAARNNGSPVFPNGQYTLRVVFPSSSVTVTSTRINATVANP